MSNKQIEALKLALESLEKMGRVMKQSPDTQKAITAIRSVLNEHGEALMSVPDGAEQPAPPPECQTEAEKTAFAFGWWKALEMHRTPAQQQEQEPVAWMCTETKILYDHDTSEVDKYHGFKPTMPLYAHPAPQSSKPWVGLTAEEIERVCVPLGAAMLSFTEVARAIEAKLREKNTGETK